MVVVKSRKNIIYAAKQILNNSSLDDIIISADRRLKAGLY